MINEGLAQRDGVEAKAIVIEQLVHAIEIIRQHNPARRGWRVDHVARH
jgi:hypothetical protein